MRAIGRDHQFLDRSRSQSARVHIAREFSPPVTSSDVNLTEKIIMGKTAHKRRSRSFLSLSCGCSNSKSACTKPTLMLPPARSLQEFSSADTHTRAISSSSYHEEPTAAEAKADNSVSTPSFSELLGQLSELEQSVLAWSSGPSPGIQKKTEEKKKNRRSGSKGGPRAEDGVVVVVRETADPFVEFRRSMLQMIVEREIVDGAELRELLYRFLALNSPRHHATILGAFAEIWEDVFAGYERTPDVIRRSHLRLPHRRLF